MFAQRYSNANRLVNLGRALSYPLFVMCNSFGNQTLAQLDRSDSDWHTRVKFQYGWTGEMKGNSESTIREAVVSDG